MTAYVLDPTWPGDVRSLRDETDDRVVVARDELHHGLVWDLRRDTVELGDGQTVVREYVAHPGAVCVIALDDADRVFLLRQYRHPVGMSLWEPVAGLLDVADESPWVGAARELVEEAGLVAARWDVLVDAELLARRHERDDPALPRARPRTGARADARPATARSATCR